MSVAECAARRGRFSDHGTNGACAGSATGTNQPRPAADLLAASFAGDLVIEEPTTGVAALLASLAAARATLTACSARTRSSRARSRRSHSLPMQRSRAQPHRAAPKMSRTGMDMDEPSPDFQSTHRKKWRTPFAFWTLLVKARRA